VKAGRVKNPLLVLDPQARRMSHIFDIDEWTGLDLEGVEFGTEDEDDEWKPQVDPYFELRLGGRREKEIPDIAKYLP
jgi:hypothetical protein